MRVACSKFLKHPVLDLSRAHTLTVAAKNTQQRYFGILAMIVGALYFAYGVTHIVNIVEELNQPERVFAQQLDKYNQYMQYRSLSKELKIDIREFLNNVHRRKSIGEAHNVRVCVLMCVGVCFRACARVFVCVRACVVCLSPKDGQESY